MDVEHRAGPPAPPEPPRAIHLTTLQRVGIPILFVIPVLALFGVFGEHFAEARASAPGVAVWIRYPDRMHYRQPLVVTITVRNTSPVPADSLTVEPDSGFILAFPAARFAPPLDESQHVAFHDVAPGESRSVTALVTGDRYWRHRGSVRVRAPSAAVRIPVTTFVFP